MNINKDIVKQVNSFYGFDYVTALAMEEFAEAIQAVNKIRRYGKTEMTLNHLNEEIADCLILIEELKDFNLVDDVSIQEWIEFKQHRELELLKEREGND